MKASELIVKEIAKKQAYWDSMSSFDQQYSDEGQTWVEIKTLKQVVMLLEKHGL